MQEILIVEDDWQLNQGICYVLEKAGFAVSQAHSIEEGKTCCLQKEVQLILLDVNLPDGEGFTFCKWVKERWKVPVLFLTARDLEEDALKGYELGAEDYVTKPFSMNILMKKINVILKRAVDCDSLFFEDGFLKIDLSKGRIEVNQKECGLTPTEFRLLQELVTHRGQLLTYDILLQRLWDSGGQFVDKHALAVNVNRLRRKIEDGQHNYISNVYGMGYQWMD